MYKKTAHWVLGLFDFAALLTCYFVYTEWNQVNEMIAAGSNSISIQQNFQYMLLIVLVPVTHLMIFGQSIAIIKKQGSRLLIILFLTGLISAFLLGSDLDNKLQTAGYQYCAELSEPMTFSEFRTYLNETKACKK